MATDNMTAEHRQKFDRDLAADGRRYERSLTELIGGQRRPTGRRRYSRAERREMARQTLAAGAEIRAAAQGEG